MFLQLISAILRFRWQTAVLSLCLTGACWFFPKTLPFDGDMLALLGTDDKEVLAFEEIQERVPFLDALFLKLAPMDEKRMQRFRSDIRKLAGVSDAYGLPVSQPTCRLVAVILSFSASDIKESSRLIEDIRELIGEDFLIGVTGTPAFLVESHSAMQRDIGRAGIVTFFAILIFFVVFYRAGFFTLLALIPVGIGIIWGLALASLALDRLGLLAATVPTLMVGIGIDVCLHLLQATRRKMVHGENRFEAVRRAVADLGRPIALGGLSTCAAFLGLASARLKGLHEMGIIGFCLTLGVFTASIIIVPLLLVWIPQRWMKTPALLEGSMDRLAGFVGRQSRGIMFAFLVLSIGAGFASRQSRWLSDLGDLEHPHLPSKVLQTELANSMELSTTPLVVSFPSPEVATSVISMFYVEPLRWPEISRVMSVPGAIEPLILIHPAGNPFRESVYFPLMNSIRDLAARAGGEQATITGSPVLNARVNQLLARDWWRVGLVSLLGVAVLLFVGMGKFRLVFMALIPLAIAVLWTAGMMSVLGVAFSVMTVAIAPLVVGIGVDDGVHMLHSWGRHQAHLASVFKETGVAVVATTVTTLAAFGSFVFSQTPALVQFGFQGIVGLSISMVASLTILPLVAKRNGFFGKNPKPQEPNLGRSAPLD